MAAPYTLYSYYRSSTAYRLRIALHLKQVAFNIVPVNLLEKEHHSATYRSIQPQGLVPALVANGKTLLQSPAVLEWLEETHPAPALLPKEADARAAVRAFCAVIGCDVHPVNNLRLVQYMKSHFGIDQTESDTWMRHWMAEGFSALETLLNRPHPHQTPFAFGANPSLADVYLIPQLYNATRFHMDLSAYPTLQKIADQAATHPAFLKAHPDNQPDCPIKTA